MSPRQTELVDEFQQFLRNYYDDAVKGLAQRYPNDQRSLAVDWDDLYRFDPDLADDYLRDPDQLQHYVEEALRLYDLPVDVSLGQAHVRVTNLPDSEADYPGGFSPTDVANKYRAVTGEISKATSVYSKVEEAAFECQRCGTLTRIPQSGEQLQEPHECQGCERQGPFDLNFEQSEFVDGQTIQLQTPPDVADGDGQTITVALEDDLVGDDVQTDIDEDSIGPRISVGDRVTVSGTMRLEQQGSQQDKKVAFDPRMDGNAIEIEESDHLSIDISQEDRERIRELADGAEGDPLDVAAAAYHTGVYGYESEKKSLILAIVGGATDTDGLRGELHVLLIGDPSTGKSELIEQVGNIAPKSVAASSNDTTSSGLTTTATQDEWGDGSWTLEAGAFVKANKGVLYIDELDDLPPEDRASMLDPMSKQRIHVSKAGINATLSTETTVVAAANPEHGRFDQYEPIADQFDFQDNLLSRFDLVWTFHDRPGEDNDHAVADHITKYHDQLIRKDQGRDIDADQEDVVEGPISEELLRKWLALAKRQPDPVYESESVRESLRDSFVTLRGLHGYEDDEPVPVTHRKLSAIERVAFAIAKLQFSEVVTEEHAQRAIEIVGESIRDYQTDEDGNLDADVAETGASKSQKQRREDLKQVLKDLRDGYDDLKVPRDDAFEMLAEEYGHQDTDRLENDLQHLKDKGIVVDYADGLKYIGDY